MYQRHMSLTSMYRHKYSLIFYPSRIGKKTKKRSKNKSLKAKTRRFTKYTVKYNPIASFPSTKLYLDVGRLLVSSFFFTSPRLSSYFLYFLKISFHHINESQKKTMALLHKKGLNATDIAKDLKVVVILAWQG